MKFARSLALLGLSTALAGSQAIAADYFVKAITPGAVTGTPLAIIALQASGDAEASAKVPAWKLKAETSEQIKTESSSTGERAGKWLSARKGKGSDGTAAGDAPSDGIGESTGEAVAGESTGEAVAGETTGEAVAGEGTGEGAGEGTGEGAGEGTGEGGAEIAASGELPLNGTAESVTSEGTTGGDPTGTPEGQPTVSPPAGGGTGAGPLSPPSSIPGAAVPAGAQLWANFDSLMKSGKVTGGDRIFLLDGYHGQLLVRDKKFASTVTIAPAAGAAAHADSILVMNSSNVHFQGLMVWPRSSNAGSGALVRSDSNTSNVSFTDLDVRGIDTAGNYASWSASDWNNYQRVGFQVDGSNATVARSRVTGIFNGIVMSGQNALMEANIVDGFSGDGMRTLGDNSIVRRNKVQNCHQVNASHTDGFQSWSRGAGGKPGTGTIRNVTIEDNKIFEYVGTRSPIACKLQGISMFDGVYENFLIRNNVVSSTAYHGISMGGGLNSQIVNNTVIHAGGLAGKFPWIRVSPKKDGTPSRNVTVANNLVTSNKVTSDPTNKIVETNNITVTNAGAEFTSLSNRDFNLRTGAKAIDAGTPTLAPKDDIAGTARPKGKAPDAGAYENF